MKLIDAHVDMEVLIHIGEWSHVDGIPRSALERFSYCPDRLTPSIRRLLDLGWIERDTSGRAFWPADPYHRTEAGRAALQRAYAGPNPSGLTWSMLYQRYAAA